MSIVTEAPPVVTPVAVETTRVYAVAGAPPLPEVGGLLFRPDRLKAWDRLHGGWCVVVYGQLLDGTRRAARVFADDRDAEQLPDWAHRQILARRPAQRETERLMRQMERWAHEFWVEGFDTQAEHADIERQLLDMAHTVEAATGQPGQPRILVRQIDRGPGRKPILDAQVTGVAESDEAVALLMMVVERLTGVSAASYMDLVDAVRRVAARERERGQ